MAVGEGKNQAKAAKEATQAMGSAACRHNSTPDQATAKRETKAMARRRVAAEKAMARVEARIRMSQENKDWCNLSKRAQERHLKNDTLARVRSMIPGIGKICENSVMLQAAATIKQFEAEIESLATHLEILQEKQSSNGTVGDELQNSLKDENVPAASVLEPIAFGHQAKDGNEVLRSVLPQPSKAKGTRLLNIASEYMTELVEERDMMRQQVADHGGLSKQTNSSANQHFNQNTAEDAHRGRYMESDSA